MLMSYWIACCSFYLCNLGSSDPLWLTLGSTWTRRSIKGSHVLVKLCLVNKFFLVYVTFLYPLTVLQPWILGCFSWSCLLFRPLVPTYSSVLVTGSIPHSYWFLAPLRLLPTTQPWQWQRATHCSPFIAHQRVSKLSAGGNNVRMIGVCDVYSRALSRVMGRVWETEECLHIEVFCVVVCKLKSNFGSKAH